MFAVFHSKVTATLCHYTITTSAGGILIFSAAFISICGGIPSNQGDLFSFIMLALPVTTSAVTLNRLNIYLYLV